MTKTTIEEIYQLFEKLNQDYQIKRVAQLIEMPKGIRPTNYNNLEEAKTRIVDWAEEREERFSKLKCKIEQVIGVRDLSSQSPSKKNIRAGVS